MQADLVDEHHDAKANLMDAVKRGFSLENIQSIVKLYVEHQFLGAIVDAVDVVSLSL